MKKAIKKLSLSKETLRILQEPLLGDVAGGAVTQGGSCRCTAITACLDSCIALCA
jgi:hypothetical protein